MRPHLTPDAAAAAAVTLAAIEAVADPSMSTTSTAADSDRGHLNRCNLCAALDRPSPRSFYIISDVR